MNDREETVGVPDRDCSLCTRLVDYRERLRTGPTSDGWNAPVPSWGDINSTLLIVGLAPGARGANHTGRPFTGDWAGDLLYATLLAKGFAVGDYQRSIDDGLQLHDVRITNAVRCVPPQNKPNMEEQNNCRRFLRSEIDAMPNLKTVIALGKIAHDNIVRLFGKKMAHYPFAHGQQHRIEDHTGRVISVRDSYHCSRYNTNTKRLTSSMFMQIFDL